MNKVEFHYNVADKFGYLVRLLRKVIERDLRAVVTCPAEQLVALDQRLWAYEAASFLPHCLLGAADATRAATPIWLCERLPADAGHEVLINFGTAAPAELGSVQRLLELVGADPADAQAGRERWRQYQGRGFDILPHDRRGKD